MSSCVLVTNCYHRVEQSVHREKNPSQQNSNADIGFQLHVSFSSTFMVSYTLIWMNNFSDFICDQPHEIIKPTEEFLTEIFRPFGAINDILIRAYTISPVSLLTDLVVTSLTIFLL